MHGIWIMAGLTVLLSAVVWGGLIYIISRRDSRYLLLALAGLPLSALVNLLIKSPLITAVSRAGDVSGGISVAPVWFVIFIAFVPPVTEELIKVLPLVLPKARALVDRGLGGLSAGMALGVGFGIGEALYIASSVAGSFQYAGMEWYLFTGFLFERFVVCFIHGVMTAVFVTGIARGGWHILTGYLAAVLLHLIVNGPIILVSRGLISQITMGLLFQVTLIVMAGIFAWLYRRARRASKITGPEVEHTYFDRSADESGPTPPAAGS